MMPSSRLLLLAIPALLPLCGCKDSRQPARKDFTTPQGAVYMLEEAYRRQDIEAAVQAKAFRVEARLLLQETMPDVEVAGAEIDRLAETLELGFREQIEAWGFPDFETIDCTCSDAQPYDDGLVVVVETCIFPDGGRSMQRLLVADLLVEWKVVMPIE